MRNTNKVDEAVKVTESDRYHDRGALQYTHPSYGMIKVSRMTCSGGGQPLFGAKNPSSSVMAVTISKAENKQNLGSNWCYSYETLTEVEMTPVQYAELISNPNTEGVPCTIKYTSAEGYIVYRPPATEIEYLDVKINSELDSLASKLKDKKARAKELLSQKGVLKKSDKEELLRIIQNIDVDMSSNIPFYKKCMEVSLEKMVMEANSDIESLVNNVQTKLGKALMDNPEALKIILEDKKLLENK